MTEEQAKKIKKKDKESSELKGELSDEELKGLSGGQLPDMDTVHLGGFGARQERDLHRDRRRLDF